MGFKADTSFLRFLTMGALGVKQTIAQLRSLGFDPIELERYCASNKIWSTKVKRLRLPDLLCVRTGVRIEVRAKADLKIRMSHAERNPGRYWDAGLRPTDLIAFIACHNNESTIFPAESAIFFSVEDLRLSYHTAKIGPPKSASEGAERDLTWPSTVPKNDGVVLSVDNERIRTQLDTGRRQTYLLKGKNPYVSVGDRFTGLVSIIAGTVSGPINPDVLINETWNPLQLLASNSVIDRYAATKALPFYEGISRSDAVGTLESAVSIETDERVCLEMGASLARMNSEQGFSIINQKIENPNEFYIPMEAVFILTEIGGVQSADELQRIAASSEFSGNEVRQAAVWGLGKAGAKAYDRLIQFIDDNEDEVALHAIAGFDANTDNSTVDTLIDLLLSGNNRQKAASCAALRQINTEGAANRLIKAATQHENEKSWIIAALGQLSPDVVRPAIHENSLLERVQPFFRISSQENWLATDEKVFDLKFLISQDLN